MGAWAQTVHLCEGDYLQEYWVVPTDPTNTMQWGFIMGNGAEFVSGENTEQTSVDFPVAGTYVLQFEETNQYGCVGAVILDIVVHALPAPSFSYGPACVGQSITFVNTSLVPSSVQEFVWSVANSQDTSFHIEHTFYQEGVYPVSLYALDEWGCENTYTQQIQVNKLPEADFYHTPTEVSILEPEAQFVNLSTPNTNPAWDFGDGENSNLWEPVHLYHSPGWVDVALLVQDENGCRDSINKPLFVKSELVFYVPDGFTPNGDNINDHFGPVGFSLNRLQSYQLQIYSQWGEVIFESTDVSVFWDGRFPSGMDAPVDTYVWSIRMEDEMGKRTHHTGSVTLSK